MTYGSGKGGSKEWREREKWKRTREGGKRDRRKTRKDHKKQITERSKKKIINVCEDD